MTTAQTWEKRFARERSAREQAEAILEARSAELYAANQSLEEIRASLEETVLERTSALESAVQDLRAEIERREAIERELIFARDEAVALSHQKEEFLAKVSHEIRTPLNSIVGFTRLLRAADLPPEAGEKLKSISNSCGILLRMVNDLLTVSRINADGVELELNQCDLAGLVDQTLTLVQLDAEAKGIELAMQLAPGLPKRVDLDIGRLQQVLINLVSNAVKYTDAGTVVVKVRLSDAGSPAMPAGYGHSHDGDHGAKVRRLEIEVSDTGQGIAPESLPTLWEPFVQVNSAAGEEAGSGLGLAICDKLCGLMGGAIEAESEVGRGSTFRFWLPCLTGSAAVSDKTVDATARDRVGAVTSAESVDHDLAEFLNMATRFPLRILAADDNHVNRTVLQELLALLGYQTDVVSNGEEALRAARMIRYDVILMDVRMPHMDGEEATAAIRADAARTGRPFIVAVTANAAAGERERLLADGMDDYLAKPVDIAALAGALQLAHARSNAPAPADVLTAELDPSILNLEGLYQRLGPATDGLLSKVIPIFLRELPGRLARLQEAKALDDAEAFGRVCHALKGSSLSVGAEPLATLCSRYQLAAEDGRLPDPAGLAELEDLCRSSAGGLTRKLAELS